MADHFTRDMCSWLRQIADDRALPDSCCRLAIVLGIEYMSRAERCAWPSQETLARDTGYTAGAVSRQLATLVAAGHLEVDAGAQRYGRGHTNRYRWRLKCGVKTPAEEMGFREPEIPVDGTGFSHAPATEKPHSLSRETPFLEPNKPRLEAHANHLKEPSEEPSEAAPSKKAAQNALSKRRKTRTTVPPDFCFDEGHRQYAESNGWDHDRAQGEFEAFIGNHRAKGNLFKDWNLAWQNWVRNGVKFDRQRGANGVGPANSAMGGILRGLKRHLDRRP